MGLIVQITGDRNWKDRDYIFNVLDDFLALYGVERLRCGCARGVDRICGWPCPIKLPAKAPEPPVGWATSRGVAVDHFPADWDTYGPPAGPIRNRAMLRNKHAPCIRCGASRLTEDCPCPDELPDVVLAFHPTINTSKGTADMLRIARKAGIKAWTFPSMEVPFGFNFNNSVLFPSPVTPTGLAPNPEDAKLL